MFKKFILAATTAGVVLTASSGLLATSAEAGPWRHGGWHHGGWHHGWHHCFWKHRHHHVWRVCR